MIDGGRSIGAAVCSTEFARDRAVTTPRQQRCRARARRRLAATPHEHGPIDVGAQGVQIWKASGWQKIFVVNAGHCRLEAEGAREMASCSVARRHAGRRDLVPEQLRRPADTAPVAVTPGEGQRPFHLLTCRSDNSIVRFNPRIKAMRSPGPSRA